MYSFEWHNEKAILNNKKHKVSFEEAQTVFDDPLAIFKPDNEHSNGELRSYLVGNSVKNRLLVISFTERNNKIRIITARLATKNERKYYESQS